MDEGTAVREPTVDQRVDALAARQYGAIGHRQAKKEGMDDRKILRRRRSGRWVAAGRGVSVVAAVPSSPQQQVAIAILRVTEGTVASHLTAAALHGICGFPLRPHVTVPPGRNERVPGVQVHRSPLSPEDITEAAGLPATTPARCLVDAASLVGDDRLCDLVDTVLFRRLATVDDVLAAIRRASKRPGRTGLGRLERALEVWTPGAHPGSEAEMRLMRRIQGWGLPLPERQLVIRDENGRQVARVDGGYPPPRKVAMEYQGKEFHGPRHRALDDERRAKIEALGWTVIWVTSTDLRLGAAELRQRLTDLLKPRAAA
jgi:hypothetical protein